MTTRIESGGPDTFVSAGATAARTTVRPARPFQELMRAGAEAIVSSAEQAATRLPGGPILAAAFRPGVGGLPASAATTPEGASSAAGSETLPSGSAPPGSIESALAQNADQKITVRGDQSTAYANIVLVLDICKGAGIQEPYLDTVMLGRPRPLPDS